MPQTSYLATGPQCAVISAPPQTRALSALLCTSLQPPAATSQQHAAWEPDSPSAYIPQPAPGHAAYARVQATTRSAAGMLPSEASTHTQRATYSEAASDAHGPSDAHAPTSCAGARQRTRWETGRWDTGDDDEDDDDDSTPALEAILQRLQRARAPRRAAATRACENRNTRHHSARNWDSHQSQQSQQSQQSLDAGVASPGSLLSTDDGASGARGDVGGGGGLGCAGSPSDGGLEALLARSRRLISGFQGSAPAARLRANVGAHLPARARCARASVYICQTSCAFVCICQTLCCGWPHLL